MFKKLLLVALIISQSAFVFAQTRHTSGRPYLIVGIMIDGLQQRPMDQLWDYFEANGLRKIAGSGVSFTHVSYNIVPAGNTSDIATVMTGSVPYYHGITGDRFYNSKTDQIESFIDDPQQVGIGTDKAYSAHNLLASTIVDELHMANPEKAKCYAVGIDPNVAIMMGGHTANSAVWIDDINLKWVGSGYYKDGLCKEAEESNTDGSFQTIADKKWKPLYAINTYVSAIKNGNFKNFSFNPTERKNSTSPETILRRTPSANSLVADLAIKIINEEELGQNNVPDILMLQFTVRTPNEKFYSLQTPEKEDMYLRLDKDITKIVDDIQRRIGLDRTLFFMFGNQTDIHSPSELGENNIPAGYFSADRSMALLNTYLMAIYGQAKWVEGYYGKNIFLNKQKIAEEKLNLRNIEQQVAEFMLEFEGVQSATPTWQLLTGTGDPEDLRIRNSINKKSAGDVIITLMPGWLELDDQLRPVGESNNVVTYTPVSFAGWNLPHKTVTKPYAITDIAATLSTILNIPEPNACIGKPMTEVTDNTNKK